MINPKILFDNCNEDIKTIFNEFDILTSALGLVTALAWNEAFKNYFQNHKTLKKYGPLIYAISVINIQCYSSYSNIKIKNGIFTKLS